MANQNPFLRPTEFYKRQINPITAYINQSARFLQTMTGDDFEDCFEYVKKGIQGKFKGIEDPIVDFFYRGDNGDKEKQQLPLSKYIKEVIVNEELLAPTFTSYINPKFKKSAIVGFLDRNVYRRSVAKKQAHAAEAAGDMELYIAKEDEQKAMKGYNNACSGTFAAQGSVLHNPTAHNTLTSVIRTVSSIGNASNEKLIAGNRHYYNFDVVLHNLISITNNFDEPLLQKTMDTYDLVYPTVDDVIDCITYSSDLYIKDEKRLIFIRSYVEKITPLQRAAFVYVGDLFHVRKHNPEFVRTFLTRLSRKIIPELPYDDPVSIIRSVDEQVVNYSHQICMSEVRGIGKDYGKIDNNKLSILAATCLNVDAVIKEYYAFIESCFLTTNLPCSSANIVEMMRRTVVLSDTDSTMFSVDDYVLWYFGDIIFSDEAFAVAGSVMYLATQCISHGLAIFSANINVEVTRLYSLAMKPEFVFPVFAQTPVAKHYFTCMVCKEGSVYDKPKMEIKGVHLKNSASPLSIVKPAHKKMEKLLLTVMDNEKISITQEINDVMTVERNIYESLQREETEYFKQTKVKNKEAYKSGENDARYQSYVFWDMSFKHKYGEIAPPPYSCVKIPTKFVNKTALVDWINGIEDERIRNGLIKWIARFNKKTLPTIYLSLDYVKAYGIPSEIKPFIDVRSIILDLTIVNRMVLGTLGYYPKLDMLITEHYSDEVFAIGG